MARLMGGRSVTDRFWAKVQKGPGCWEWQAATRQGYGAFRVGGVGSKIEQAHRFAWMLQNGPIPEGKMVLHKCGSRKCVRHLYLGDHAQNMRDMVAQGRTQKGARHWSHKYPHKVRRGEDHHNAQLDEARVERLRQDWDSGQITQPELAVRYGIGQTQVSRIINRQRWAGG